MADGAFSDLPIVNDPRDLTLKGDGMALCVSNPLLFRFLRAERALAVRRHDEGVVHRSGLGPPMG